MTRFDQPTRRRVLQAAAGTAVLGVAGCLGSPASASSGGGTTETQPSTTDSAEGSHHDADDHPDEHAHAPTEHESGHGHAHGDDAMPERADHATFRMTTTNAGDHFEPHMRWLNVGGTATWVNESGMHSATAYHPKYDRPLLMPEDAEPFDSGLLTESGAEYERTFETEGINHFFCLPHETVGMLGSLIVGDPDPHDAPALDGIPASLPATARGKLEHLNEKVNEALGHTH